MKAVPIGKLRHRLQIQRLTEAPNDFGELVKTWESIATVWAMVEPLSSRELMQAQQVQADVSHRITMRYYPLNARMRLKWGARIFNLEPPRNPSERGGTTLMEVMAKEEVT